MSTTLLASASRDANFVGDAVDVSAASILRCTITLDADIGRSPAPQITVALEGSPDGSSGWETLWSRSFFAGAGPNDANSWRAETNVSLGGFPNFVRVRTSGVAVGGLTASVTAN